MAIVGINSLETIIADLSDTFEIYSLSGSSYVSEKITFADLSNYFYSTDTFAEISAKYESLMQLLSSFEDFIKSNYPNNSELSSILTTAEHLSSIISELETVDKAKQEFLEDYATNEYAELKKSEAYANHEQIALETGSLRGSLVGSIEMSDDGDD